MFGSNVIVKSPDYQPGKPNKRIITSTFLQFRSHNCNIILYDNKTRQTQSARHLEFDESHYYDSNCPPHAQKLRDIYNTQIEQKLAKQEI